VLTRGFGMGQRPVRADFRGEERRGSKWKKHGRGAGGLHQSGNGVHGDLELM
jgi:hypothetical protein